MGSLASINIKFFADLKDFSTKMQNSQRKLKKMGKNLQKVGSQLSVGLTLPLLAFGAKSLKSWDEQQKAIAQVEAGLRSTGNAVGYTSGELQKMASDLQNTTLFGDEEILKGVTSQLLTFTNIAQNQFKRTQVAALDLATRLDGDLKSASIQLGKALNDPIANLSALSRSGIQFSEDQKAMIKSLVETNKLADAQTLILNELENQYGGSAAAAAKAGLGPLKQLGNILGDLSEDFGAIIGEAILPFVAKIKEMAQGFRDLSPATKKFIVVLGGIAAAIGPLLALAGTILPAIATGFAVLTGPIGLVVAALVGVAVVIAKNWAPIKQTLIDIANYFIDLYNESIVFRIAVEAITLSFKNMYEIVKFVFGAIIDIVKNVGKTIVEKFKSAGKIIKTALTDPFNLLKVINEEAVKNMKNSFTGLIDDLGARWKTLGNNVGDNFTTAINNVAKRAKIKLIADNVDTTAVEEKVKNKIKGAVQKGLGARTTDYTSLQGTPAPITSITTTPLPESIIPSTYATELTDFELKMMEFQETSAGIMESVASDFEGGFANVISQIAQGNAGIGSVFGLILNTVANLAIQLGIAAIGIGEAAKAIKSALIFPGGSIIAGVALIAIGGIMKGIASNFGGGDAGAFANGGIVGGNSFYGDKLFARVNSGEAIFNQQQQKRLYELTTPTSQAVSVTLGGGFEIDGNKLRLVLDRTDARANRTR